MDEDDPYQEFRPLLFSIAYRMVGSVSEAEDIVQESFLRFHGASNSGAEIRSPKAFLSTVTTRLSIDHLRSARARRETYVGSWLPEPLLTDPGADAAQHAETAESLAFLVLLERLTPVERAVFLLREVFDYDYGEIAVILGKNEDNCRQLAMRARRQVEARKPRFEASRCRREELARRFFAAAEQGDTEGLISLLGRGRRRLR
jgi:RNA polymerase sigma-70 factor (ECF subfamily)